MHGAGRSQCVGALAHLQRAKEGLGIKQRVTRCSGLDLVIEKSAQDRILECYNSVSRPDAFSEGR